MCLALLPSISEPCCASLHAMRSTKGCARDAVPETDGLCSNGGGADLEIRVGAQVEDDQQLPVAVGVDLALRAAVRPPEVPHHLCGSASSSRTGDGRARDRWWRGWSGRHSAIARIRAVIPGRIDPGAMGGMTLQRRRRCLRRGCYTACVRRKSVAGNLSALHDIQGTCDPHAR